MEKNKKTSQVAVTTSEGVTESEPLVVFPEATIEMSSEQIARLKDSDVALLLYYLIHNATNKNGEEIEVIGKMISGFAIQSDKLH